jgi:hypothetical protein
MTMRILTRLLLFTTLTACGKKDESGKDQPAAAAAKEPAAAPAKASKEECEKVVANQLALEKDPSMKSAMEMSKDGLMSSCLELSSNQARCAAGASDNEAFASCLLQK